MSSICPCSVEDRSRRVVMVRRLHPAVTMQSLLQTFGAFGSITGCKVFTHKSGRSAGCASLEFANHSTACAAYQELQGAQLNSKAIHLQWFDPTLASPSPSRPMPGQLGDIAGFSPGGDALNHNHSSCMTGRSAHQPATPHSKVPPISPHMAASPFGLLASSPHHSAFTGAAPAGQQQQSAAVAAIALLAGGSRQAPPYAQQQRKPPHPPYQQQQQLHRQSSAPLSNAFNQALPSPAGLHVPPSPHMSLGGSGFEALPSPGPGASSDPGSLAAAAAAAAAVANLSAAMTASMPMGGPDSSGNLAALQLAAMHYHQQQQQQMQQQLACLALQQMNGGGSHHDSPLSPARSLQHQQQQQQQTMALAAALHSQQQQQQQALQMLQHQMSGQLPSPGPTQQQQQQQQQRNVAQLHLARSMPAALGSSVGSSCSSFGSQGQLWNSAMDLMATGLQQQQQQQAEHAASRAAPTAAAATAGARVSPFAINQQAASSGSESGATTGAAAAEAAGAASSSNVEIDIVPPSAASLNRSYQAKKQLFRGDAREIGEQSLSLLLGSSISDSRVGTLDAAAGNAAAAGGLPGFAGQQAGGLSHASMADDTTTEADDAALAAAYSASSGAGGVSAMLSSSQSYTHWSGQDLVSDMIPPDLLAALRQMSAELDASVSPLQTSGCNAAAVAALQHQQLLAAVASSQAAQQQQQQQQQLLEAHFSAPHANADAASAAANADSWAMQLANMRARDARASDSQVLLGTSGQRSDGMTSFRLSSPSLPGCYSGSAYGSPGTAEPAAAVQAWQQAAMSCNQQEQMDQQRSSFSNLAAAAQAPTPASQAFRDKHKQQLQLQLPEFDLVSAPLTSAQLTASTPFDQRFEQLITTEVMPDTPATAALQSPLNVQAAMLAAASDGGAASSALYGSNFGSSGEGTNWVDWNSMAALLSPMHMPGLATRRFTDCSVPASADHTVMLMQQEQQRLRQQHSRSAAGNNAPVYGRHSTSFLGDGLTLPGLASLSEQQAAHAASAATAANPTSSSIEMFGLPSAPARCGDASGAFGRTRHSSLCLDAHSQLVSFSLGQPEQQQLGASEAGSASNSSSANARFDSDAANAQAGNSSSSNVAGCLLKRGHLSDGNASGGLHSTGSFTFRPPVLQQLLRESRLASSGSGSSSGGSSSSDAMITEPFQMPSFFRRSEQSASGSSSSGGGSSSSGGGSSGSPTKAAAAAAVGVSALLPRVSENGSLHQQQADTDAGSSETVTADEASRAAQLEPSSAQQQQQTSNVSEKGQSDTTAAAAAALELQGSSSPAKAQQQQQQQQPPVGGFDDVYRSLFGSEVVSSSV